MWRGLGLDERALEAGAERAAAGRCGRSGGWVSRPPLRSGAHPSPPGLPVDPFTDPRVRGVCAWEESAEKKKI